MRIPNLGNVPLCRHMCTVHPPATIGSVARDAYDGVRRGANNAARELRYALVPPHIAGVSPQLLVACTFGAMLGTTLVSNPVAPVALLGLFINTFLIAFVIALLFQYYGGPA